jgi:hypothetical protein
VTIVIRRRATVFVGLAAAAALLTACSSGPSQVGSALIVGDSSIPVSQVQQELNQLLATQPAIQQAQKQGNLDQASRSIVTSDVLHDLVGQAAARDHLAISDQEVQQVISQSGGAAKLAPELVTTPADLHSVVKDVLLEKALATKFADTLTVNFAYFAVPNRAAALTAAKKLAADPGQLGAMIQASNATAQATGQQPDSSLNQAFSVADDIQAVQAIGSQAQQQGQAPPALHLDLLLGAPTNTVVAFPPAPSEAQTYYVALIKSRNPNGAKAPAGASAADSADLATLGQIGVSLLRAEVADVGVRISPRYGVWDPVGMSVVANSGQTIGVELPAKA